MGGDGSDEGPNELGIYMTYILYDSICTHNYQWLTLENLCITLSGSFFMFPIQL